MRVIITCEKIELLVTNKESNITFMSKSYCSPAQTHSLRAPPPHSSRRDTGCNCPLFCYDKSPPSGPCSRSASPAAAGNPFRLGTVASGRDRALVCTIRRFVKSKLYECKGKSHKLGLVFSVARFITCRTRRQCKNSPTSSASYNKQKQTNKKA